MDDYPTITGEGHRLLRLRDFNGNLDGAARITRSIPLGDDRTQDITGVGAEVAMREFGAQAGGLTRKKIHIIVWFTAAASQLRRTGSSSASSRRFLKYIFVSLLVYAHQCFNK